jgi:adenine-specific DNA methylase
MTAATQQKAFGAFYTDSLVAKSLIQWALTRPDQTVLDPSCGEGVFLKAGQERLRELGATAPQVWGVDICEAPLRVCAETAPGSRLLQQDFFSIRPGQIPQFDCIAGNPPFIRYQNFNGAQREQALKRAAEAGAELPELSSSWAPFVVHATKFLRCGGSLGMVVPVELGHAQYAREVLKTLAANFREITVRMFRDKLFADLSQSTILLQCRDYGKPCEIFTITSSDSIDTNHEEREQVELELIRKGKLRFAWYVISNKVRTLYQHLSSRGGVLRLGEVADVGIGYVTGHNNFFHLSEREKRDYRITDKYVRPALLTISRFAGLEFTKADWLKRRSAGEKVYLLAVPSTAETTLPDSLRRYLQVGRELEVPNRYKCAIRDHWYAVPHVRVADAFLTYMSGQFPTIVANQAKLVAPNTVHLVRFVDGHKKTRYVTTGWCSSLTRLSCELEGHALGGGLLKLEPSEAERVVVAVPAARQVSTLVHQLEQRLAKGDTSGVIDTADRYVLRMRLGLSKSECLLLRDAAEKVKSWRIHK